MSDEKRWPVSDREVKPWWFHAINYGAVAFLVFCALVLIAAAVTGWVHVLF